MKTKQLLRICLLWAMMIIGVPRNIMADRYYEYEYTENVTIECGEIITLDPSKISGCKFSTYYYNRIVESDYYDSSSWTNEKEGIAITNHYYIYNDNGGRDSYKCDIIGLKPGTYNAYVEWYVKSKYVSMSTGLPISEEYIICRYKVTVKPTSNPQITLAVSDTCKRVVKGTNIKITPSISGASVYYYAGRYLYQNIWENTYQTSGITLNEVTPRGYRTRIEARGVKRGYPASDLFKHEYEVIEPGDFHVLLAQGSDIHFRVISESNKTCGVYFVPETATGELRIPSQINGYKVTRIQEEAFEGCKNLTSVVLPEGIDSIGDRAFYGCTELSNINIPKTITAIGGGAFRGCTALTSINIPNTLTVIDGFSGSGLENIDIPSSVTKIAWGAFQTCKRLKTVILHEGLKEIEGSAFSDCSSLEKLEIPSTVESLGQTVCWKCENLKEVVIPNSVKEIGAQAFRNCKNLESVTSLIEEPFPINEKIFGNYTTYPDDWSWTSAKLYVLKGCKEKYASTGGWLLFNNIEEIARPVFTTDVSTLDNVIYMETAEVSAGSTATLSFRMKNSAPIFGFQFDLYLPEGVTAVKNARGRIQASLSGGRLAEDDEHTLTVQEQADGAIRFLCGSMSQYDEAFTGNDGEIVTLEVNLAEDLEEDNYPVVLKNMRLSEADINKYYDTESVTCKLTTIPPIPPYTPGDINGDEIINVSDYIGVANYIMGNTPEGFIERAADVNEDNLVNVSDYIGVANIILTGSPYGNSSNVKPASTRAKATDISAKDNVIYAEPMTVTAGTQAKMSFRMKNSAPIFGFQFDLYLPEGVTVVKNARGRIMASLSGGRLAEDDEHTLTVQEQADGAIRFLCGSMSQYDEAFAGNEGEIATLQVNIAEDMPGGGYPIVLKAMRLSEIDISKYYDSDNVETTLTVEGEEPEIINFASDKVKELCIANWDRNGDGELSLTEAAAVTTLGEVFTDNWNITSFDELQYFTGITEINENAFNMCDGLTSVIIPSNVTSIGNDAFGFCGLRSCTIPNKVTSIGITAFGGCDNLKSVIIPKSVTTIGTAAFGGCTSLTSVTVEWGRPIQIDAITFDNQENATLYVPFGTKSAYMAADYWKDFNEIVEVSSGTKGDLNGDNKIDIADAVSILNLMAEGADDSAADLNGDGKVDIADFVSVLNLMAGQ